MKTFALRDEADDRRSDLAYLMCYERTRAFYLELPDGADPWGLPFILHEFAARGQTTVDAPWSLRWVRSRLVPTERQNLGEVLRVNGLEEYDELRLLTLTEGRCAQDSCYLVPVRQQGLPAWLADRQRTRLADAYALPGFRVLALFKDGLTRVVALDEATSETPARARILSDVETFGRMEVAEGGRGVCWGSLLAVDAKALRSAGVEVPLSAADVAAIAADALMETREVAAALSCTRQNVSDLVRRGRLTPVKQTPRGPLFLRRDVRALLWE